jgi:GNAT superfamily N-acetyltransferase
LKELESVFAAVGLEPEVHLSPVAEPSVFQSMVSHGYVEKSTLSTYWCTLEDGQNEDTETCTTGATVVVRRATLDEAERFIDASATGFLTNGRSHELLRALALIGARRTDTSLYFAFANDEIAGTAAMATMETTNGKVAHLYLDSTLRDYRGRGIQLALIRARLLDAARMRLGVATTITRVGDGSARNAERAGLRRAYTTAILSRLRG